MEKSLKLNNVYASLCLACRPKKLFSRAAILLSALFFSLSIFSCDNSSSDNMALFAALAQPPAGTSAPAQPAATVNEKQMVSFSGCLGGAAGAFPARMSAQVSALLDGGQSDGLSMSAAPTLDTEAGGGYEMFATATAEGVPAVEGVFGTTAADKRFFSMSLEVGKTWSVVCGIRAAGGGSVMEDSYDFEAKITSPVLSHTFNLTPKKDGSGSVALSVTADSTVTKAVALCFDEAWKQAAPEGAEKALDLTSAAALSVGSLKSGSYEVSLNFFKDDGNGGRVFLYSVLQTINVFDNAATDMWISSAGEGKIQADADGKTSLVVDGSEIMAAARTIFYVSDAAGAAALEVFAPSDSNSGSAYEPLESLERAVQIISAAGNSANKKEYKIFVNGNVPCNASLDSSLDDVALGITITGLGASGSSDALQGDGSNNSVVTLATKAPVTIKNLSVTGGRGSSGAGVNITASGARLVLASGAKVFGNTAAYSGGGVSVCAGAELEIQNGAEISANECNQGGGLYIFASNDAVPKGGTIKDNTGGNGAGGVQNHGTFKMSGGTIENNKANYVGAVLVEAGSIFEISGSASIPYGALDSGGNLVTGEGKNDVFLSAITDGGGAVETITVAGNLYASGSVATIHAKDWPRGKQVLAAGAGVSSLSDDILEKFDFTDTDFHVNRNKSDARQGLLAGDIYVAGSGYRHCHAPGSDAAGVAGTKNAPFASIGYAASKILDGGKNTILVDGSLGAQEITSDLFAANCSELTIKGWSDATHPALDGSGLPVNKLDAGRSGSVFKTESSVPIVMENLMITGGNATNGGGIYVASGATVTLGEGACVAGNKASYGGGVYVAGDLLIDGGVVGDKNARDHAKYDDDSYSNYAGEKGGGVCFDTTGKVTLKSGFVAYNYSKKRGGGIATSFDASSDNSQLDLKGGEVSYNCAGPHDGFEVGGGLFLKGCKFYFTSGKVHHNYAVAGGGGICLQKTVGAAIMSGGRVYDNEYRNTTPGTTVDHKWGSDLLLFDEATLDMSGGRIYSSSQKDYGVMIRTSSCALNISGNAEISKETPLLPGDIIYNEGLDTYTYNDNPITIAGALTPPDPADLSKKNVYIVPSQWKRGLQVLNASASIPAAEQAALVAANIGRFATIDPDFLVEQKPGAAKGVLDAPIYIAGSGKSSDVTGSPTDADSTKGTRSSPYASLKYALENVCDDATIDYKVIVSGSINGGSEIPSSGFSAKTLTIEGYYQDSTGSTSMNDRLRGVTTAGSEKPALTVDSTVPVTIKSLGIVGGYRTNLDTSSSPCGGGIYIPKEGAHVTLAKGSCVGSNSFKASSNASLGYGAGIYIAAGASVYMCQSALVTSNYAGKGGGIYNAGNLYLGYKYENGAMAEEELTGGVKSNGDTGDGSGIYTVGKFLMKSGSVSSNKAHNGGGIYSEAASADDAQILGGSVQSNEACFKGGGFYVKAGGHLRIEDCAIKGNTTQYQNSSRFGGGAYCLGTLRLGKKANFQNGTTGEYKNDIALDGDDGKILVEEAFEQTGLVANLSLAEKYVRGKVLLEPASTLTSGITTAIAAQFAIVDPDFSIAVKGSGASAAGVAHAPVIYVASDKSESDARKTCDVKGNAYSTSRGSRMVPFAKMSQALEQLKDESVNYVIKVDGTVNAVVLGNPYAKTYFNFTEGSAIKAASVTLEGANGDNSFDILDARYSFASENYYVLRLAGSVPLTLKNIKITGGFNRNEGGGIIVEDGATLVLDEGALIEGNRSLTDGAGIYAGGTVKVVSAATVWDNKKGSGDDAPASNIYLPAGKKIIVDGALATEKAKAKIGVSCADAPVVGTPVVFTQSYGYNSGGKNANKYPSAYFSGDKYAVALDSALLSTGATGDGILAVGGGSITVEDLYKDVSITASRSVANVSASDNESKRVKFTAKLSQNGSTTTLTPGGSSYATTSGRIYYSDCKVYSHGELVPQSGNYSLSYDVSSSDKIGYIQFTADMPAGTYMAHVRGVTEGKSYGASFEVKVVKNQVKDFDTDPSVNHKTPARAYGGGSGGSAATYIYLGDYPQTLKADDVEVYNVSANKKTRGNLDFYPGSDGNWYTQTSSKWYKLEPIKWRVLTKSYKDSNGNDVWLLLSEKILDAKTFFNYYSRSGSDGYNSSYYAASCYYFSIARAFLDATSYLNSDCKNSTTYNSSESFRTRALSGAPLKQVRLPNTEAAAKREDGTGSSPSSSALGAVTYRDAYVFVLSRQEATRTYYDFNGGEGADPARVRTATDWAEASGATSGKWVTRSMYTSSSCYGYDSTGAETSVYVTGSDTPGLVPAICIAPMN